MSGVRCQVSCVRCQVSHFLLFSDKVVELVVGGSVINGAYPVNFFLLNTFIIKKNLLFPLFFLKKVVELVSGGYIIMELPHIVFLGLATFFAKSPLYQPPAYMYFDI